MTKSDFGFHDRRRVLVKLLWLAAAVSFLWLFELNQILIERLGELGAVTVGLTCVFGAVFLWNAIAAPAQLHVEADTKITELEQEVKRLTDEYAYARKPEEEIRLAQ